MGNDELAALLYCGHGRAALVIQREGIAQHRAALLEACVNNPVYDRQIEGERTGARADLRALCLVQHLQQ